MPRINEVAIGLRSSSVARKRDPSPSIPERESRAQLNIARQLVAVARSRQFVLTDRS